MHDGSSDKKAKGTKKICFKLNTQIWKFKECLLNNKAILKSQRFKRGMHNAFTETINKIALSSNDDKR